MSKEKENENKKSKLPIIITVAIVIILIVGIIGGYIGYQYIKTNKTTGSQWGDTYYSYLKSVKEADEEKIQTAGLSKEITTAQMQFVQVKNDDNPQMVLTYQKDDEKYTNIYFIEDEQNVNVITYDNPTTLKLLYNREIKEYVWYLYSKEDDKNSYKALENILKEAQNETVENSNSQEPETSYTDYTFNDNELESNFEVAEGEIPTISKFDKTFIETELDENKLLEINFEEEDKELKQEFTEAVEQYKTKEEVITEEVKTKTEEQETTLKNKEDEIKQLEEKKKAEEEAAKKAAEEEAAKKATEEAAKKAAEEAAAKKAAEEATKKATGQASKSSSVKTGKYNLTDTSRSGSLTIKSATESSVQFDISVVNLFGGNHMGELSATAKKTSNNKYVYTTTEYGKTYKFYMEVSGNSIKVSTSKMLNGDGFDPFCGVNAVFDGTYTK